jgi:hypothetical protein
MRRGTYLAFSRRAYRRPAGRSDGSHPHQPDPIPRAAVGGGGMGSHADLTQADLAATFPSFTRNRRRSPSLARKRCRSLRLHLRREGGLRVAPGRSPGPPGESGVVLCREEGEGEGAAARRRGLEGDGAEDRARGRRRRGEDERAVGDGMRVRVRRGVLRGVSGEE